MTTKIHLKKASHRASSTKLFGNKRKNSMSGSQIELFFIAVKMKESGLADKFIVDAVRTALELDGVLDLMHLWVNETDEAEKNEIIADIQDLIDASCQKEITQEMYVKFNDLDAIAKDIRAFKDSLYQIVMKNGGVGKLSELTGIPQPSLSRFFNSNAMPRRATVLAIANALNLDGLSIDLKWSK